MDALASILATVLLTYLAIGGLVAAGLVLAGPARLLAEPQPVSAGARLLLIPGAALLWPIVVKRWIGRTRQGGAP